MGYARVAAALIMISSGATEGTASYVYLLPIALAVMGPRYRGIAAPATRRGPPPER